MKKIFLFVLIIGFILPLFSCKTLEVHSCLPIYAMDTTIEVTLYNDKDADKHYNEIKKIYQRYDKISSDFVSNEEKNSVYDLNEKRQIEANPELKELLEVSLEYMEKTDGYFNVFMGRLTHLWKDALKDGMILEDSVIVEELEIIEHTTLDIREDKITLNGEGNVDLGGIAKGYATEKAKLYLEEEGVNNFLINAGNSNVVFGKKGKDSFRIALQKPYQNENICIVEQENQAIGTSSGKYQNTIVNGIRYHHLLNAFTGKPSLLYDNINVMTKNSIECDVYATALFSMPLEQIKEFCMAKGIDVLVWKENDILYQTGGWNVCTK